eukprot:15364594-Ditylum_brightwellii.AAC.2
MDIVLGSNHIHTQHIDIINWCRLYIKACFVSDISSAVGKYLGSMFKSNLPQTTRAYTQDYRCPRQEKPNTKSWQIFTGQLKKILCLPERHRLGHGNMTLQTGNGNLTTTRNAHSTGSRTVGKNTNWYNKHNTIWHATHLEQLDNYQQQQYQYQTWKHHHMA